VLTLDELLERIASRYDEVTIMEALEITSEQLVERFSDKVNIHSWKFDLEEEDLEKIS
tara:strand:- start:578 stop:751 length:174 start_codon:yes stop_codon:yes gene_type:complete